MLTANKSASADWFHDCYSLLQPTYVDETGVSNAGHGYAALLCPLLNTRSGEEDDVRQALVFSVTKAAISSSPSAMSLAPRAMSCTSGIPMSVRSRYQT